MKHILFPVDFSERCDDAVPFVEAMAHRLGAKVTLLAAAQVHYAGGLAGVGIIDPQQSIDPQQILEETSQRLEEWAYRKFQPALVSLVAQLGDPATMIADFVQANPVDLVMMPTHGYGPFRQLLLGSVTAKVLHDVACPVWTTAHTHEDQDVGHKGMHKIICAVDSSSESASLMRWSAKLAKQLGASLQLVHAVPGMEAWPERQIDAEFENQIRETARQRIRELERAADIDVKVCVGAGIVADVVAEEARQHGTDLVIIGRGAANQTFGRLRTHAHAIIRHAPCPVLSV
jgi:nucleotide-binding universal stress UspA family protein